MKTFNCIRLLRRLWVLTLASAVFAVAGAPLRVGMASKVLTPNPLLPISGGVGPSTPVKGKAGELQSRALVVEKDGEFLAMVSVDFLGFPSALGDRVRELVKDIPAERILIGATHTHSAPDPYGFPNGRGGIDSDLDYLDKVCGWIAASINQARADLGEVDLHVAAGQAKGKIAYNAYAEALFDPTCSVLQFRHKGTGKVAATLINYACHPEVLGTRSRLVSPDFVGPLYERLEAQGGGFGIFFNAALGGMVTADNRQDDGSEIQNWQECQRIGRLLADEALRLVSESSPVEAPDLRVAHRRVAFEVESEELQAIMKFSPIEFVIDELDRPVTSIQVIDLGPARLATIPGEALPNVGAYLKRRLRADYPFLLGLTNDAFGYILAAEDYFAFPRYNYISRTSLGEKTADTLADAIESMRQELDGD